MPDLTLCAIYTVIFLYGITIGSFLNVCIYRLPLHEDIVKLSSHCMTCGQKLHWYDLIPVFSFLGLRGKCRYCGQKLSIQYPLVELINGILYCVITAVCGLELTTILYCLLASALLTLSVIDFRTYEIPLGINIFIFVLGVLHLILRREDWLSYTLGFLAVSLPLYLLFVLTKGRGIGGGDIKLMAAAGLLLGWKYILLAFILGCILGSVIHIMRMKIQKADHVLAFGPYLSAGILISLLFGEPLFTWYLNLLL